MLLTITYTGQSADDLGYLLHKNPTRVQEFSLSFGKAFVFYPVVKEEQCTVALTLDLDTIGLLRRQKQEQLQSLQHYVNDRPYVMSSFFSVAIAQVFGTALNGRCQERPELVDQPLALEATLSVVSSRGGEELLRKLFEPLGYDCQLENILLDPHFPEWGQSSYFRLHLKQKICLKDLLSHLYVLLPVLDRNKHYWVQQDEQEKLLRHGEQWLVSHPERKLIVRRYLKRRNLAEPIIEALEQHGNQAPEPAVTVSNEEEKVPLNRLRLRAVTEELTAVQAKKILDLGCGSGKLIQHLLRKQVGEKIIGVDPAYSVLTIAKNRLKKIETKAMVELVSGSVFYRDDRLRDFDAAVLMEVIEHLEPNRLRDMEEVCFSYLRPRLFIVTTPNQEYNVMYSGLEAGEYRHGDHRFEWTRAEFRAWAEQVSKRHQYELRLTGIGEEAKDVGQPTQMAVFYLQEDRN
ncbi:3' terminal RNA ribose 2'-O-methyltransferase Hen1 [Seinonella peptonophila]|uniref:Small RNA 2'-O-methyltransferase n=1 Tax=Seinonella peptonophila TaxID=112248 RepID=A0A1M5AIB9_9BACL|nr:3' terminal RNA ribose 2'-O-methyltransferase Hen1 [Seinonella peptonophila]SHF29876.1 3' terminal RNA ribose 2'-O-methyltransferase Hen1 [Seinonella peptonophila]